MDLGLKNRRVLVTGSSRGIGRGIASAFLAEGARVALTGRSQEALRQVRAVFAHRHGASNVIVSPGDLTIPADIARVVEIISQRWRGLDVLILNLGSGRSLPGLAPDVNEWNRVLSLNLVASVEMLRQSVPLLSCGRNPAVVFIGSIAGQEALGAPLPYGAAKAGLYHTMKAAARELGKRGLRVNMVSPGNIFFKGGTWDRKSIEDPAGVQAMLDAQVPLRRFGSVTEVSAAVVFLASPRASFITGACLTVDGGQSRG